MLTLFKSPEFWKAARYSLTGAGNTVLGIVLFYLGSLTAIPYPVYTTAVYAFVTTLAYFVNRSFTFRSKDAVRHEMLRYFVFFGCNVLAAQLLLYAMIEMMGIPERPAVFTSMIVYTVAGYLGSRFYIYTAPEGPQ